MKEIIRKLQKYEIQIRKAVNAHMSGEFKSVFKGTGLDFDDVRQYQYGDDIRTIDWNVTARGQETYVKTYREEKEQSVYFVIDLSASQDIGRKGQKKSDITKEITGILSLSAAKESSNVGLIAFTDQKEIYIKPEKTQRHVAFLIGKLFKTEPKSKQTNIEKGLSLALGLIKRRSVVILISDFIDKGYEKKLKALGKKHDLIVIHVYDLLESRLPRLGIIPVQEKETGKTRWINTSLPGFRKKTAKRLSHTQHYLKNFCRKYQIDYLPIDTSEDYVPMLVRLFKKRNKTWKTNG